MTLILAIILAPFAVLMAFFAIEVLAGLPSKPARSSGKSVATAVIVIPAHDEAAVIGDTLKALVASLGAGMRILVVADNCRDNTAQLAREAKVEVIERWDTERRGKGYALAFAAEHLRSDPPDVFVVLDADCATDAASLRNLVGAAAVSGRPSQAINLLRPDRTASPLVQLSTFGFMLKNLVRQRGLQRLAGRVHLTGTGMAIPYELFETSARSRSSIVEDLALGLELAAAGHPSELVPNAAVWSGGSTEEGTMVQRRRWEGGFLSTGLRWGLREAGEGFARFRPRVLLAGLDLMIPPLALFALLNLLALIMSVAVSFTVGADWWPVLLHAVLLGFAILAVFAAWLVEGRRFISLGALARLPLYVLWKVPMYLRLARRGAPKEWLRTGR